MHLYTHRHTCSNTSIQLLSYIDISSGGINGEKVAESLGVALHRFPVLVDCQDRVDN